MPSGVVFQNILTIDTDNDTGATPTGKVRTSTIDACNDGSSDAVIKVYISTSASAARAKLVEPNYLMPANGGGYIRTFIAGPGERIIIRPNTADVIARISCFEEDQ